LILRPYQVNACDSVRNGWAEWLKQLLVLPTGAGKTIVAAKIAKEFVDAGLRVLFIAHREELLSQTLDKFSRAAGIFAQLEKAEHRASLSCPVVVASIQTLMSRGERFPADHFALIIVDEAHHILAESYLAVLRRFSAKVLGITATSDRGDKKNLGAFFQNIACEVTLFDLINQGYLSRIHVKSLPLKIDLSEVKSVAGDYDANGVGNALEPYLGAIAQALKQEAGSRRILAFLPLIATSQAFVRRCADVSLRARHIDGNSPDRKEILQAFANDEFDLLSNAMLLTEGFDDPGIDCIVNLRPTRSRSLYSQIVGRGTRVAPMKENLLLLDFLWQHEKHNLIRPAHLVAPSEEIAEEMTLFLSDKAGGQEELDLEDLSATVREAREKKLREELEAKAKRQATSVDAMDFCLSVGSLAAAEWTDTMEWHARPPSERQIALIKGAGIDPTSIRSRGHASAVIDLIQSRRTLGLASAKQVRFLRRLGHAAPESATKEDAGRFIAARTGSRREEVMA
jgi:superfamily II DNA or RNA helicase